MKNHASALAVSAFLLASLAPAQALRVDYPDSVVQDPPVLRFPFYTLGSGGTIRYQTMCPSTFSGLPAQSMIATKVGMQIAGQARYDRFEIRFGTTSLQNLDYEWLNNLPNQRIQTDLSGTVVQGGLSGGVPQNQWVEFDLAYPVVWQPGQSLTLDIIASASSPGNWCLTAIGNHERLYEAPYTGGLSGILVPDEGIKLRVVFEPLGFPLFGQGCQGSGGFRPAIGATGSSQLGGTVTLGLSNALGGVPTSLLLGLSRTASAFGPLPAPLGGGCTLLTSMELAAGVTTSGSGPGTGTASFALGIPNVATLLEAVVFAQWVQFDASSPAVIPVTTSDGAVVVVR